MMQVQNLKNPWKNKKVLVVVLGAYGGGVATAKWLLKHGAIVSVTDFRTEKELADSLKKFTESEKKRIHFILGGQREKDFTESDLIVAGPGVPNDSPYLIVAREAGVPVENEASIFFENVSRPVLAITGTRGKTTVASWIATLLHSKYPNVLVSGNAQTGSQSDSNPLLSEIDRVKDTDTPVVAELSSWQLEYVSNAGRGANVALITNIFPDHLNRYGGSMEKYARAKANIFLNQSENNFLILNAGNVRWTKFFLSLLSDLPESSQPQVFFFSSGTIPTGCSGVFVSDNALWFRYGVSKKKDKKLTDISGFVEEWGQHNLENLAATVLAIHLFDPQIRFTKKSLNKIKNVAFRQEIINNTNSESIIVNDSASTSPDAVSSALKRFCGAGKRCVLITGGTDKELDFSVLAQDMKKYISSDKVIFLNGTATKKLLRALFAINFFHEDDKLKVFETLEECVRVAKEFIRRRGGTLLFSPGAASFEKFKNEFDRGEQFNTLCENLTF